jgi:hypothetical protein
MGAHRDQKWVVDQLGYGGWVLNTVHLVWAQHTERLV